jgi:hypothetical protein
MVKRVYFLGAGFSKAISTAYPTLIELTEVVLQNFLRRHDGSAIVTHFNSVPKELRGNLELMLSYLFSDWPWKTTAEQELDISLYRHIAYEICLHLSAIKTENVAEEFKIFANYLGSHNHGIVSLNYDTLLEELSVVYFLLKETTLHHNYRVRIEDRFDDNPRTSLENPYLIEDVPSEPLSFISKLIVINRDYIFASKNEDVLALVDDPRLSHKVNLDDYRTKFRTQLNAYLNVLRSFSTPRKLITLKSSDSQALQNRILKLHGSIDWINESSETIRVCGENGSLARKEKLPLIVPPILDKAGHYKNQKIRDVWFNAHSAMEQANEIIVAGFSFPLTDLSVRYLFQSVLNRNPSVRIVVLNRDSEENLNTSYGHVFSGEWSNNVDYRYCGRDDSLRAYIAAEIIRS